MGLNVFQQIDNFIPKLNDTFRVYIRWNENDELQELQSCIGFTIPQPKYKDEYQFFGNQAQRFLIPDYESFDDVKIELYEYNDLRIGQLVSKCLSYNYDFKNNYYINKFIYQLLIEILDNNFEKKVYTYDFRLIKLTNYENYELGTEANDPTKWSLSFSYMYFHQGNINSLGSNIIIETDPDFKFNQTPMNIDAYEKEIQNEYSSLLDNSGSSGNGSTPAESTNPPSESNGGGTGELPKDPTAITPSAGKSVLEEVLKGNALAEYKDYLAKLKAKDKNFNEMTDCFIFFDIATNTKYAVQGNKIIRSYTAFTAVGDADKKNGEAPEGVYKMFDVPGKDKGGNHASRKWAAEEAIRKAGLKVDDLEMEVASGKYRRMYDAMKAKGIDVDNIWYDKGDGKGKRKMKAEDFDFTSFSKYSDNLIDEGNENTYREKVAQSGINSHINGAQDKAYMKTYMKKKNAGTNTAEDDYNIRKQLAAGSWTQGCSVMSSEDINWEKQFMQKNGGKVYEFKANGTSSFNKNNDSKH